MAISMQDIKELRELTGAGLMEVKKALEEANGDKDAAVKAIRLAGKKSLAKREDRSTAHKVSFGVQLYHHAGLSVRGVQNFRHY